MKEERRLTTCVPAYIIQTIEAICDFGDGSRLDVLIIRRPIRAYTRRSYGYPNMNDVQ